ncbi:NAD(P)-dependent oxidoreductase [Pseudonocardia kongjuensis]|uniref:NAD(P)-dependent oxidoreductase n=2 Tax=Pseudonocardia kongjuensis TaxID=102227 RepID=A0ABN1XFW2_9PSEU
MPVRAAMRHRRVVRGIMIPMPTSLPPRPVIGILHPGAMGAAIGSALKARAGAVIWADAGRSHATAKRAELADLVAVPDVAELAARSDVIVSICPPHAAREVAEQVAAGLAGRTDRPVYLEANAIAPDTVRAIAQLLGERAVVCDGAVIGPPAWQRGTTVLWLSGPGADALAGLFDGSPFDVRTLDGLGAASGLKACFALQSKALPTLWLAMAEAAARFGVTDALHDELARGGIEHDGALADVRAKAAAKGWRWAGEMDEAAAAFAAVDVPDGFSRAAAELYRRAADRP